MKLKEECQKIIDFYIKRVKEDFDNFEKLSKDKCKYDDFIKYILCFGSCLNYNKDQGISDTGNFLKNIDLKENFEKTFCFDQTICASCINDKQMLEYSLKKSFQNLNKNEDDLNKKMKVFYLLHLLEKNNALHVPRNIIKSFSLIKDKKEEIKIK